MKITVHGNETHYELDGPPSAPVLLLSHPLATTLKVWEPQRTDLAQKYRVLLYDTLGHGGSGAPCGPYTLEQLAEQAGGLIEALGINQVHFLGLSMGGMIGQTLALVQPHRVASLMIANSSSRTPPEAKPLWAERIKVAESEGMEPLVEPTIGRWFTAPFRQKHPEVVERVRGMIRGTSPLGYAACCHAIAALDLTDRIHQIRVPTLILVGESDQGMPVEMSRAIQERVHESELSVIPSASHLANTEQPGAFTQAVTAFLHRVSQV
jgi:3-oxoadipate enol-lactonase